jgi:hypothetical protein
VHGLERPARRERPGHSGRCSLETGSNNSAGIARYFGSLRHFSIMLARPHHMLGAPPGAI